MKKKKISYMSNGKVMIIHLTVGLIEKALYKMSQSFSKPYEDFERNSNVKNDFSNYATFSYALI